MRRFEGVFDEEDHAGLLRRIRDAEVLLASLPLVLGVPKPHLLKTAEVASGLAGCRARLDELEKLTTKEGN
ncbi:hypothetical protein [Zavarzinella formosa]|uniref:hypothetical protein n=1 Tax=Zavarzinella formosa TaxID=360055 RepID=UPI00031A11C3|nr:hypothetical protein [Zavarzinella formosa]